MNPAIVIPTYWAADPSQPGAYDHATAIDEPLPELARCLDSLDEVRGVIRTIILLVAPPAAEASARARVNAIIRDHPALNPLVIGSAEARVIFGRIERLCPGMDGETVSLRGYGAIRNMGLVTAAMLGHDVVVFLDDDEVALSPDFLIDALYGLRNVTRQDLPLLAKTGHFVDAGDSHIADESATAPWERWWTKRSEFNEWMRGALTGTRICRSNYACGGCMAIHADAFSRVAFDPWITRGEDLDYLFNLRLVGLDMWFDSQWYVRHLPPATPDEPNRFLQDVYRWLYERAKLAYASRRENLRQVTAASLMPYPGSWISPEVEGRINKTVLARIVFGPDRQANFRIWRYGREEARVYAERNAPNYLRLLSFWPRVINGVWDDEELCQVVLSMSERNDRDAAERSVAERELAAEALADEGAGHGAPADGDAGGQSHAASGSPEAIEAVPAPNDGTARLGEASADATSRLDADPTSQLPAEEAHR